MPIARLTTSSQRSGPTAMISMVVSGMVSLINKASSTANSSSRFILNSVMVSVWIHPLLLSIFIGLSASGTCLTQTNIFIELTIQSAKKSVNKKTNVRSFFLTPPQREGIWCQEFGSWTRRRPIGRDYSAAKDAEWGKKERTQCQT